MRFILAKSQKTLNVGKKEIMMKKECFFVTQTFSSFEKPSSQKREGAKYAAVSRASCFHSSRKYHEFHALMDFAINLTSRSIQLLLLPLHGIKFKWTITAMRNAVEPFQCCSLCKCLSTWTDQYMHELLQTPSCPSSSKAPEVSPDMYNTHLSPKIVNSDFQIFFMLFSHDPRYLTGGI